MKYRERKLNKHWKDYLTKVAIFLICLMLFSQFAGALPTIAVFVIWLALTLLSTAGAAYRATIRKVLNQFKYKSGGNLSRLNNGRLISIIVCFAISAFCAASLLIEAPKWHLLEWLLIVAAAPLYIAIHSFWAKRADKEIDRPFDKEATVKCSYLTLAGILSALYLCMLFFAPVEAYTTVRDAIAAYSHPFAQSSSALIATIGKTASVVDGVTIFGVSIASSFIYWASIAFKVFTCATAFLGIANIYGTCSLDKSELKYVFLPIDAFKNNGNKYNVQKRFVATMLILPVLTLVGTTALDAKVEQISKTDEFTYLEDYINEQLNDAAYLFEGKYFDARRVDKLIEEAKNEVSRVTQPYKDQMIPLIDKIYQQRIDNVDTYLDWYYRPTGDYELLLEFIKQLSGKAVEETMQQQFEEKINQNVDMTEVNALYEQYKNDIEAIKATFEEKLAKCELDDAIVNKIKDVEAIDIDYLEEPFKLPNQQINGSTRLLTSLGVGAISAKVIAKPFFAKMAAKLTASLASKGLMAGGAVSANAPAVVVGVAATFATDFLVLKADEALNRDTYKQEIIDSINESKKAVLDVLQGNNAAQAS